MIDWVGKESKGDKHEQALFYALKDGLNVTEADVRAMLDEHGAVAVFDQRPDAVLGLVRCRG